MYWCLILTGGKRLCEVTADLATAFRWGTDSRAERFEALCSTERARLRVCALCYRQTSLTGTAVDIIRRTKMERTTMTISRRSFLTSTLVAGTESALAPHARSLGANDDIRVAVVGFHGQGGFHLRLLRELSSVRVVAGCDVDRDVLDRELKRLSSWDADTTNLSWIRKTSDGSVARAETKQSCRKMRARRQQAGHLPRFPQTGWDLRIAGFALFYIPDGFGEAFRSVVLLFFPQVGVGIAEEPFVPILS